MPLVIYSFKRKVSICKVSIWEKIELSASQILIKNLKQKFPNSFQQYKTNLIGNAISICVSLAITSTSLYRLSDRNIWGENLIDFRPSLG